MEDKFETDLEKLGNKAAIGISLENNFEILKAWEEDLRVTEMDLSGITEQMKIFRQVKSGEELEKLEEAFLEREDKFSRKINLIKRNIHEIGIVIDELKRKIKEIEKVDHDNETLN